MAEDKAKRNYDRKILKIAAPVFAGLIIPVVVYITYMSYHPLELQRDGTTAVYGFWLLNNVIFPAVAVVLLLVQWFIILSWWGRVIVNFSRAKVKAGGVLACICVIVAALLGFFEWRPQFGVERLILSIALLFFVQLIYWIPNLIVLYLIDRSLIIKSKTRRR